MRRGAWFLLFAGITACGGEISLEAEKELGDRYAAALERELRLVTDAVVLDFVRETGARLVAAADDRGRDWHFHVVDDTIVNAFAVPGGHIYLFRGLIERAEAFNEFAGVMAHEIAHVTLRHSVEQMKSRQKANILVTIFCTVVNVCGSTVAQIAIGVGGQVLFAKYSREDEAEADSAAVRYLVRAGIDPHGVPAMFERLLRLRGREATVLDAWLGSHPVEEARIARTTALIARYPAGIRALQRDDLRFAAIQERLRQLGG